MTAYLGEFEQLILLALLRLGPGAGTPAVRDAVAAGSGRTVWMGAVFTTLERLEQKGLVRSTYVHDGPSTSLRAGKRRKTYALEPAGEKAIARAYGTWARMTRGLKPKLERS
jgi:PadR family transcriptional regulator, regulatory protein PadR